MDFPVLAITKPIISQLIALQSPQSLFLDKKRKLALVKRIQKRIAKFTLIT
jgi:hypothetical protein